MPKPQKDLIQQALKDLLSSPQVTRQIASDRKALGSAKVPRTLIKAVETGDIKALCKYLRQNPTSGIPQPICELMERLRFLSREIAEDWTMVGPDSEVILTGEWLEVENKERLPLPVGTSHAIHQTLVDLAQAWLEGIVKGYTIAAILPEPQGKIPNKRGPKKKVDSAHQYGDYGVRECLMWEMKTYVEDSWPKAQLKKAKAEDPQHFEDRAMDIVQTLHAYMVENFSTTGAWDKAPLPENIARTIVQKAMTKTKKSITSLHLICGLLALYERDDPAAFIKIRQLLVRKV